MSFEDLGLNNLLVRTENSPLSSSVASSNISSGEITGELSVSQGFIRSKDYIPGVSGWTINDDGTIEFVDGTFRGIITGATIQTSEPPNQRITINSSDNFLKIYDSSNVLIGSLGGSTEATERLLDLIPSADNEVARFFAQNTTGTSGRNILYVISKGYQTSLRIRNENTGSTRTTNNVAMINLEQLGTGSAFKFANSNPDSDGKVFDITQSKVSTTEPVFKVKQDGVTSTNFRKILTETNTGISIWISNGTTAEGNLTGVEGDICLNGGTGAGQSAYCDSAGTNWTDM